MSIRLIASDMDGTLLDPYSNISAVNAAAIRKAQEQGIEFIISSGRDYQDAKGIVTDAGITCAYICLSGATVYDVDGNVLVDIPLTEEELAITSRICQEYGVPLDLLTSHGRFCTAPREKKFENLCSFYNGSLPFDGPIPQEIREKAKSRLEPVHFISRADEIPPEVKIYKVCGDDQDEETIVRMKEEFAAFPSIAAASSFPTNIELTGARAQKGHALKTYAGRKNIPLEDVMILGDSDNDLSMFTGGFGWTVAMENSMDCIRDAARFHTKSNIENGVAWAIEHYALKTE